MTNNSNNSYQSRFHYLTLATTLLSITNLSNTPIIQDLEASKGRYLIYEKFLSRIKHEEWNFDHIMGSPRPLSFLYSSQDAEERWREDRKQGTESGRWRDKGLGLLTGKPALFAENVASVKQLVRAL